MAGDGRHSAGVGAIKNLGTGKAIRAVEDSSGDHLLSAHIVSSGREQGVEGSASIAKGCAAACGSSNRAANADAGQARAEAESGYAAGYQAGCCEASGFAELSRRANGSVFIHGGFTPQLADRIARGGSSAGSGGSISG